MKKRRLQSSQTHSARALSASSWLVPVQPPANAVLPSALSLSLSSSAESKRCKRARASARQQRGRRDIGTPCAARANQAHFVSVMCHCGTLDLAFLAQRQLPLIHDGAFECQEHAVDVFRANARLRKWRRVACITHVPDADAFGAQGDDNPLRALAAVDVDILAAQPRCTRRLARRGNQRRLRFVGDDAAADAQVWACVRSAALLQPRLFVMALAPASVAAVLPLLDLADQALAHSGYAVRVDVLDARHYGVSSLRAAKCVALFALRSDASDTEQRRFDAIGQYLSAAVPARAREKTTRRGSRRRAHAAQTSDTLEERDDEPTEESDAGKRLLYTRQRAVLTPGQLPPPGFAASLVPSACGFDNRFLLDAQTEHWHDWCAAFCSFVNWLRRCHLTAAASFFCNRYRLVVDALPPPVAKAVARAACAVLLDKEEKEEEEEEEAEA